ncbi:MAG: hypothetical protein RL885_29040 [Planctomycetota bacterium]
MATARSWTVLTASLLLMGLWSCSSTSEEQDGKPYIARVLEARREAGRARQRADRLEVARYRDAHQEYRQAKNSEAVGEDFQRAGQFRKSLTAFERATALYRRAEGLALKSAHADITALRSVVRELDERAQKFRAAELLPAAYASTRALVTSANQASETGDLGAALRSFEKAKAQFESLEQQTVAKLRESTIQRRDLVVGLQQNVRELHGDVHAPEAYREGSESLAAAQEALSEERYFDAQEGLDFARESLNKALATAREALAREMKLAEQQRQKALQSHQAADSVFASQIARPQFEEALALLNDGDDLFELRQFPEATARFQSAAERFEQAQTTAKELQQTVQQAAVKTATARSEADKIRASELAKLSYEKGVDFERQAAARLGEHRLAEARQLHLEAAGSFERATNEALDSMRRIASREEGARIKTQADEVLSRVEEARRSAERFHPHDGQGATFGQGEVALQEGQQFYLEENYQGAKERFEAAVDLFSAAALEAKETVRRELGRLRAECDAFKTELQGRGVVLGESYVSAVEAFTAAQAHDELNELLDARADYLDAKKLFGRAASEVSTRPDVAAAPNDATNGRDLGPAGAAALPTGQPGQAGPPRQASVRTDAEEKRQRKMLLGGTIVGFLIAAAVLLILARPKQRARRMAPLPPHPSHVSGRRPAPGRSSVGQRPGLAKSQNPKKKKSSGFPTLS